MTHDASAPSWSPTAARSRAGSCARPRRWAIARRRSIPKPMRMRGTCAWPTWRRASGRRRRARAISTSTAIIAAAKQHGRGCRASGLRLPVRERRVRAGLRRCRPGVHRPVAGGHRGHGQQGGGQAAHARSRRAVRAGLPGRRSVGRHADARGGAHRLSGDGEGGGRRRRARHAAGGSEEGSGRGAVAARAPKPRMRSARAS